jgi:hypothetical protein
LRLRWRASQPSPAKPASIIAQVEGSGTIAMLMKPLPELTPANSSDSWTPMAMEPPPPPP